MRTIVQLSTMLVLLLMGMSDSKSQNLHFPENENELFRPPTEWSIVSDKEKFATLKMLVSTLDGSLQKIRSVSGEFSVLYEQGEEGNSSHDLRLASTFQRSEFTLKFCDDVAGKRIFREKKTSSLKMADIPEDKRVTSGAEWKPYDTISIVSDSEYLHTVRGEILPTVPELPNYPGTDNRRVAWRDSPEKAEKLGIAVLIDPREYFDSDNWANMKFIVDSIEGKHGEENTLEATKTLEKNIVIFETISDNKKWFRLYQQFGDTPGTKTDLNLFWSEDSGFHPVCKLCTRGAKLLELVQVRWNIIDGVHFPIESFVVIRHESGDRSYSRHMKLNVPKINHPVDPEWFTYAALDLHNQDILVDRIDSVVYHVENNTLKRLADFHSKYVFTPTRPRWAIVATIAVVFICLAAGFLFRYRAKRASNVTQEKI